PRAGNHGRRMPPRKRNGPTGVAADAEEALRKWCAKYRGFHRIEAETLRKEIPGKRNQRGRPRQGEPPSTSIWVWIKQSIPKVNKRGKGHCSGCFQKISDLLKLNSK